MPTRDTAEFENLLEREQLALNNQQERLRIRWKTCPEPTQSPVSK